MRTLRYLSYATEDLLAAKQMLDVAVESVQAGVPLSDEARTLLTVPLQTLEPLASVPVPYLVADDAVALEAVGDWLKSVATKIGNGFKDFFTGIKNRYGNLAGGPDVQLKRIAKARDRLEAAEDFKAGADIKLSDSKWRSGVVDGKPATDVEAAIDRDWDLLKSYNELVLKPSYNLLDDLNDVVRKNITDLEVMAKNASTLVLKHGSHVDRVSKVVGGKKVTYTLLDRYLVFSDATTTKTNKGLAILADIGNKSLKFEANNTPHKQNVKGYSKDECLKALKFAEESIERNLTIYNTVFKNALDVSDAVYRNLDRVASVRFTQEELSSDGYDYIRALILVGLYPGKLLNPADSLASGVIMATDHLISVVEQSIIANK